MINMVLFGFMIITVGFGLKEHDWLELLSGFIFLFFGGAKGKKYKCFFINTGYAHNPIDGGMKL